MALSGGSPKREEQNATEIEVCLCKDCIHTHVHLIDSLRKEAEDSDGSAKGVAMLSNLFWREDSSTQGAVEPVALHARDLCDFGNSLVSDCSG
eukprot:6458464-Amphidinium_carterae.1